jgi:hypothetical protein
MEQHTENEVKALIQVSDFQLKLVLESNGSSVMSLVCITYSQVVQFRGYFKRYFISTYLGTKFFHLKLTSYKIMSAICYDQSKLY